MHNIDESKYKITDVVLDNFSSRPVSNFFHIRPRYLSSAVEVAFNQGETDDKGFTLFRAIGNFTVTIDGQDFPSDVVIVVTKLIEVDESQRPCWDSYFLEIARVVATRADCRRRMVGCVIVDENHRIVSTGYNGAPAGDEGCLSGACPRGLLSYDEVAASTSYDEGPGRCISIHAEANALLYAGKDVRGATAYITHDACPTCLKLLRGAGISRVVVEGR